MSGLLYKMLMPAACVDPSFLTHALMIGVHGQQRCTSRVDTYWVIADAGVKEGSHEPELQRPGQMLRLALKRVLGAGAATHSVSAASCRGLAVGQMEEHGANALMR